MVQDLKALLVILCLTLPIWLIAPSFFSKFSSTETFRSRRNIWITLTVLGLISPSIWIYLLIAFPLVYRAAKLDPNPAALFILLFFAVPDARVSVPGLPFEIFPIGHHRILALAFLVHIFSARSSIDLQGKKKFDVMFLLLLAFVFLKFGLDVPYRSSTHNLRVLILLFLDTVFVYFLFCSLCGKSEQILDCFSMWVLVAILLSAVAIFEYAKGWLLYTGINARWGDENVFAFLLRAGSLRAQASTGHSLGLGLWLAIAWPFFLVIQRNQASLNLKILFGVLIVLGLWSSGSRGPWLVAFVSTFVYFGMNPRGASQGAKDIAKILILVMVVFISPAGQFLIPYLPFIGNIDSGNVDYRIHLFEVCINLIKSNPFFGNPFAINQMESLRQGQGIIDVVNGYLQIAVFHGLVALAIFVALLSVALMRATSASRLYCKTNPEMAYIGSALAAVLTGCILYIATAGVDTMIFMLLGLIGSYVWMSKKSL